MGENEYGISLVNFHFFEAFNDAFEVQYFSGIHVYTISQTLILACRAMQLRFFLIVKTLLSKAITMTISHYSPVAFVSSLAIALKRLVRVRAVLVFATIVVSVEAFVFGRTSHVRPVRRSLNSTCCSIDDISCEYRN